MTDHAATVFLIDDEPLQAETLARLIALDGLKAEVFKDPHRLIAAIQEGRGDVVVSDLRMPQMDGLALFAELRKARPDLPFFIMTGFGTIETAIMAMQAGVQDFVTKPVDAANLTVRIKRALETKELKNAVSDLKAAVQSLQGSSDLIGDAPAMREILERVVQVARSHATVLITGETGTGKELVARAIHREGPRHLKPFIAVNCAAIPESLLEAELFGHAKGAFTGADRDRQGRFVDADGGTLFLDEIGDLPLALQPKLLRVLQERSVEPLGSRAPRKIDVRLLAATHRDLKAMVASGDFREDLYYRLAVIPISVPPLRERREDIFLLAEHFLARFAAENRRPGLKFSDAARQWLFAHEWPGNVRELENCIERAVVLSRALSIEPSDLGLESESSGAAEDLDQVIDRLVESGQGLEAFERGLLLRAVEREGGNVSRAARMLGLSRRAMQYRLEKFRRGDALADDEGALEPSR